MHLIVDKRGYVSESISYRVKGEKNPKSKRVNIGKMVDKEFVPNAYYRERKANEELQRVKEELKRMQEAQAATDKEEKKTVAKAVSSKNKEGMTYAFEKIAEKEGIETANEIIIRSVKLSDAERLLEIYAPYVLNTAVTYEYDVPSIEEFKARIREIGGKYPYLVAIDDGEIIGYAYASSFKARRAYEWSVETTIYLDRTARRRGVGRKLYSALEMELKKRNYTNINACIAYTDNPDKYLNNDSYHFHTAMGYTLAGRFHKCAYKFSTWYDMIWMEKIIAEHQIPQPETIPFCASEVEER